MTYIVSGGMLNPPHSLTLLSVLKDYFLLTIRKHSWTT